MNKYSKSKLTKMIPGRGRILVLAGKDEVPSLGEIILVGDDTRKVICIEHGHGSVGVVTAAVRKGYVEAKE